MALLVAVAVTQPSDEIPHELFLHKLDEVNIYFSVEIYSCY